MKWAEELLVETRETLRVLPPLEGTPPELAEFQRGSLIEQKVVSRKDYLSDTWCHMNASRASRPFTFRSWSVEAPGRACTFCPGSEALTARDVDTGGDTLRLGDHPWGLRLFPNLYPWLQGHQNIVETSSHKFTLGELDAEEEVRALRVMRELSLRFLAGGLFPVIFKNQGFGASIFHFHWQVGALRRPPTRIYREMVVADSFAHRWGLNMFDAIIEAERARGVRLIVETSTLFVLAPFAPRTNGEVWLICKGPMVNLGQCREEDLSSLAALLVDVLKALNSELRVENLCVALNQVPEDPAYRLHLKVLPIKSWAGAERGLEEYTVEVPPEQVAAALRPVLGGRRFVSASKP